MTKKLQKDYTKPKKKSNKGVHAKSKSSPSIKRNIVGRENGAEKVAPFFRLV